MSGIYGVLKVADTDRVFLNTLGQSLVYDAVNEYMRLHNAELQSTLGVFVGETTTDFKQATTALYPSQGVMTVTAADNSSATLTVIDSGNVSVGLDKNGDGSVDETLTTTWAALMARI